MNLQSALNSTTPYNENSYVTFEKLVENAYVELSFWGNRNVYSVGYTNCVSLEELAEKVRDLADVNTGFSEEEREIGKKIQSKVFKLYEISCDQYDRAGFIKSCFFTFIEFITGRRGPSSLHFDVMSDATPFNYYTAEQYRAKYNRDPDYRGSGGSFCSRPGQIPVRIWLV